MYLQCKHGFIEADAWDGTPVPLARHQAALDIIGQGAVVVRSRRRETIARVIKAARVASVIYSSPPTWDYEFRTYLTPDDWARCVATIALTLDYRNFKTWTKTHDPQSYKLAHDLWDAAHADAQRRKRVDTLAKAYGL